ncbi:cellulose biosynthesis cyclic di-GMP-binding regulatory protein BcsB [Microvirga zambiensis]|uniref:cellulose biosynthesis cyclic di-GMP-binding regulatory protein BcsB n=1 Tax=Microvirga zambiensis TaxID=1402137 RepID=UPI00191F0B7B|nr:cellulose biosynthesis cyclic di-GMP-binding regulatory protein BcsB [Microvirga zambiensis]
MRPFLALATLLMSLAASRAEAVEAPRSQAGGGLASLTTALPEWRRPFAMIGEDSRLVGEAASREFPIFLTAGEAARTAKIQLAYRNAISVMPETFRLIVRVNDVVVGETAVQNSNQSEVLSLGVPLGVLQAGFNSVRVSIRQTHRVDCSVNSTYELWTQLLPEQSALLLAGASGEIRTPQELAVVNPGRDGTTSIRVRQFGTSEPSDLDQASRAVQAAVMFGNFIHPSVELTPESKNESGLDLVVGTTSDIMSATGLKVPGIGPRHRVQHNIQTGNVTLLVTGETATEVDAALDALLQQAQQAAPQGAPAGIRALRNASGWKAEGGQTMTLADLGLETEPFRGRFYRQTIRLQMPADLLAADYDRVTVSADAVYASGLLPTSKMIIRVNGTAIADAPMGNTAGAILSKRSFFLPVSTFKPGLNTIDFEAETRTSADEKCTLEALVDNRERFLLSGTGEVTIPSLGRVGVVPNISSVIPGGLSKLSKAGDLTVFVPKGRQEAIETALTALAKMATISRHETKARFAFDVVPSGTSHVLALGAYDDMPEAILREAGLDLDKLRRAWRQPASRMPESMAAQQRVQVASVGNAIPLSTNNPSAQTSVDNTGSLPVVSSPVAAPQPSGMLKVFDSEGSNWLHHYVQSAKEAISKLMSGTINHASLRDVGKRADLPLSEASTLIVAQGAKTDGVSGSWQTRLLPNVTSMTVFVAPSPEHLSHAVTEVLSGSLWQQFVGDAAVYNAKDGSISTRVSEQILLVPTESLSLKNIRLIAAGWLSHNVLAYLAVLLGLFIVMTAFMQWALRSSGVRES